MSGSEPGTGTGVRSAPDASSRFGYFELHEQLGAGGAGTVHRASWHNPVLGDQEVALKRLHPHMAQRTDILSGFTHEARVSASLDHRNVCGFVDSGRFGDQFYIALEYIRGTKLSAILRRAARLGHRPPIAVAIYLVGQLCDALDHVHRARDRSTGRHLHIIHRDVSPSNIVISESGELKLIDFGIAESVLSPPSKSAGIRGTYAYMSPEAACGMRPDVSADVFAAGIIAWELITGRPLFAGAKNELEALDRVFECDVEAPTVHNPSCPPALEQVILRALSRFWQERWESARAMAEALRSVAIIEALTPGMSAITEWVDALMRNCRKPTRPVRVPRTETQVTLLRSTVQATRMWMRPGPPERPRRRLAHGTESDC